MLSPYVAQNFELINTSNVGLFGLDDLIAEPPRPLHLISFGFYRGENGTRQSLAREIATLFVGTIRQACGGYITRIANQTGDAMLGQYQVRLWTAAIDRNDPALGPLWLFLQRLLLIDLRVVRMERQDPPEIRFSTRIYIARPHEEDDTDAELDDDLLSVISIHSIPFVPVAAFENT